mgnify:CR=1 FL=1
MKYRLLKNLFYILKYLYHQFPYDGKTQVTLNPNGEVSSVVASFQNVDHKTLTLAIYNWATLYNVKLMNGVTIYANPAGDWNQGGFDADTGLTGRKLIIDNYGPRIAIGGGCFSGKDPSKVDRSAAYMARRIAVDYLRDRKAHEVLVRLAYAIGAAEPLEKTVIIEGKAEEIEGIVNTQAPTYAMYYNNKTQGKDWTFTDGKLTYNFPTDKHVVSGYNVSYELNGGEIISGENPIEYSFNTSTFTLNNPIKENAIFNGWSGTNIENIETNVSVQMGTYGELNFTANYLYNITYVLDGGINNPSNPSVYTELNNYVLKRPLKDGYDFLGWYNNKDFLY